jgi:hypothetical protein
VLEFSRSILARIADGTLLPSAFYAELDCDRALDSRDGNSEFEARWARVYAEIERRWTEPNIGDDLRALADDIRRESFLAVSRATGQHEIAGYVSDDLDLIVRGKIVGINDPLLSSMWQVYTRGEFPCGSQ